MSDTMLFGVLKMPYEMAMRDEISRIQFYQRVQQLVDRVEAQPQQEPVAWIERDMQCDDFDPDSVTCEKQNIAADGWEWIPLYAATPQRPWVELTASTILNLMPSSIPADHDGALMEFARAIEAKLKERNGY